MEYSGETSLTPPLSEEEQKHQDIEMARFRLRAKKVIKETLAEGSPIWLTMSADEQEKLADELFKNTHAIFADMFDKEDRKERKERERQKDAANLVEIGK